MLEKFLKNIYLETGFPNGYYYEILNFCFKFKISIIGRNSEQRVPPVEQKQYRFTPNVFHGVVISPVGRIFELGNRLRLKRNHYVVIGWRGTHTKLFPSSQTERVSCATKQSILLSPWNSSLARTTSPAISCSFINFSPFLKTGDVTHRHFSFLRP